MKRQSHNHGPDHGPGIACPEHPVGACMVVVDPDGTEHLERFTHVFLSHHWSADHQTHTDAGQAALRSLIAPPKPEEPLGLGAVVEDAEGAHWIKVDEHNGCNDWIQKTAGPANRTFYRDIAAVRVLSEGVTE